jgi:hypothetical protein
MRDIIKESYISFIFGIYNWAKARVRGDYLYLHLQMEVIDE